MHAALEVVAYLSRSEHRVAALEALAERPLERAELRAETGASDSTVGRIISDFEDRGWVVREGHHYALTAPGAYVSEHVTSLLEHLATERQLREVWRWLPGELDGFELDLLADATVTVAEPGDPYAPVERCTSLATGSERVRGVDAALTAPQHVDEFYGHVVDGLAAEIVVPPAAAARIAQARPDRTAAAYERGELEVWLHDDLPPARLAVFDDHVGIGGYDPQSGLMQVYVDTNAPGAREWAESTIDRFFRAARRSPSAASEG